MTDYLRDAVQKALAGKGPILWLTGAGTSAESGIPTFRGPDGYWQVGSINYRPEELATYAAYSQMPAEVWSWYLYRRSICRAAEPNAAHEALVKLERGLGERFALITQNVDGLHQRAGQSAERTYCIHGNIDFMRATGRTAPVPDGFEPWPKDRRVTDDELRRLSIEGVAARPHVLWFDESYDEENFRFESSLRLALTADILFIVGSQGTTNLPSIVADQCAKRGVPIFVIDPAEGRFTQGLEHSDAHLRGGAGEFVPQVVDLLLT